MRTLDKTPKIARRDFLRSTAGAAAIAAVAPTASNVALAEPLATVSATESATLLVMARDLYPHDKLADSHYQKAVAIIDADVAASGPKTLLADGVKALDAAAAKQKGKPYATLDEAGRVAALKSIEQTPFFQKMRGSMITALYNQPDLWIKLGYEGPSFEKGGYINSGFDDIDWL